MDLRLFYYTPYAPLATRKYFAEESKIKFYKDFYFSFDRRWRIIFQPPQSSAYKLREWEFLQLPMTEQKT